MESKNREHSSSIPPMVVARKNREMLVKGYRLPGRRLVSSGDLLDTVMIIANNTASYSSMFLRKQILNALTTIKKQ